MFFSTPTTYALRAVLFLSLESSRAHKIGMREIAKNLNIPYHFLGKILQRLSRNHLILSTKGPGGGFFVTGNEEKNKIIKIVELFEGNEIFHQCGLGFRVCSESKPCPVHPYFKKFRDQLFYSLANETIADWKKNIINGNTVLTWSI